MLLRIVKNLITWLVMGPEQKCRCDCRCRWPSSEDMWEELGGDDYRRNNGESYL